MGIQVSGMLLRHHALLVAGGSTTMAYREGEELRGQVARSKEIPVKSVVINLAADCTMAGLIAARHPSASSGQFPDSSLNHRLLMVDPLPARLL